MDSTILGSIIGIGGIFIGIIISEFIRRKSKIEQFSETYFSKKIEIYDRLIEDFMELTNLYSHISELDDSTDNKMELWHSKVLEFIGWMDKQFLYLSHELTVHIISVLIMAGESISEAEKINKKNVLKEFSETKLIIKKSLGLNSIEREFGKTSKTKISSEPIKYLNKIKKKRKHHE